MTLLSVFHHVLCTNRGNMSQSVWILLLVVSALLVSTAQSHERLWNPLLKSVDGEYLSLFEAAVVECYFHQDIDKPNH